MQHSLETSTICEQSNAVIESRAWFALQTLSRHEKKVAAELQNKGVTPFVPLIASQRQWSDRKRNVELPVFPGYVFVHMPQTSSARGAILRTQGVTRFLGNRGAGVPIPEGEIENIRRLIDQGVPFEQHPYLQVGKRVRIRSGSLDGVEGILVAINGDHSMVVSVDLIQRSLAVKITGFWVEPA
jgi:transcription antitermination factor NusG